MTPDELRHLIGERLADFYQRRMLRLETLKLFEPIAKAVSGGGVSPSEGVDSAIESDNRSSTVISPAKSSGKN